MFRSSSLLALASLVAALAWASPGAAQDDGDTDDEAGAATPPPPADHGTAAPTGSPGADATEDDTVPPAAPPRRRRQVEEVPPPPTGYAGLESQYGGGSSGGLARVPSGVLQRLRLLDHDVAALAQTDGSMQLANDIIRLVAGAILVGAGFFVYDDAPSAEAERGLAAILWASGGFGVAGGTLSLILTPRPASAAIAYDHMPMRNRGEVRDRLRFGEHLLESTATRSRAARIVDGSLSIVSSGVMMGLYLDLGGGFRSDDFYTYLVIAVTATGAISGIVTLVSPSLAERRWSAYRDVRERLRRQRHRSHVGFGVAPLPEGGAFATVGGTL